MVVIVQGQPAALAACVCGVTSASRGVVGSRRRTGDASSVDLQRRGWIMYFFFDFPPPPQEGSPPGE